MTVGFPPESLTAAVLTLPWPPSVNTYWRHPNSGPLAGRHLISDKGRKYREAVKAMAHSVAPVMGRTAVAILACPPDRRRRDLDNLNKAILDSLVNASVIEDDGLIDMLTIVRGEIVKDGAVYVRIEQL